MSGRRCGLGALLIATVALAGVGGGALAGPEAHTAAEAAAPAGSQTSPRTDTSPARDTGPGSGFSVEKSGRVLEWLDRGCPGGWCASVGVPYRYDIYSAGDFEARLISTFQDAGFSVRPDAFEVEDPLRRCGDAPPEDATRHVFWTDFVPLNARLLDDLGVDADDLGVTLRPNRRYRVQLHGCYDTAPRTVAYEAIRFNACRMDRMPIRLGARIVVHLAMNVQHRGSAGPWHDYANQDFNTKVLVDEISDGLRKTLDEVPARTVSLTYPDTCI